jgi:UDP-3-O-[3-hydroxymyristoyl] glucosamine N-acyltransferase
MPFGPLTAQAIADLAGGQLLGDGTAEITGVAPLDRAGPGDLTFLALARYLDEFRSSQAGVVLVPEELADVPGGPVNRIAVPDSAPAWSSGRKSVSDPTQYLDGMSGWETVWWWVRGW